MSYDTSRIKYIGEQRDFVRMIPVLHAYLGQNYRREDGSLEQARICVDSETYREEGRKPFGKVPRGIWMGDGWDGRLSLIQIGLDPTEPEFQLRDRQYLIDVIQLGEKFVSAGLKDIMESAPIIWHNGLYDSQYFFGQLGWQIEYAQDTRSASQAFYAGDHIRHGLDDCYQELIPRKQFFDYVGMTFWDYSKQKKTMQKSMWQVRPLSDEQIIYAADDVRLPFPMYENLMDHVEDYRAKHEQNLQPNEGISAVLGLEFSLQEFFVSLEFYGLPYDVEYLKNTVIPMLETERNLALAACEKWECLHKEADKGTRAITYLHTEQEIYSADSAKLKTVLTSILKHKFPETKYSVKQYKEAGATGLMVSWIDGPTRKEVNQVARKVVAKERGYTIGVGTLVNLNSDDQMKPILSKFLKRKIEHYDKRYLKRLYDANDPKTEIILDILKYKQASNYSSKYGRGFLKWVTARNYLQPQYNQLGSDKQEVASGRTSMSQPPIHQMAKNAMLCVRPGNDGIKASQLLRSAFIAETEEADCVLLDYDWSNIEPRYVAQATRDPNLIRLFREDLDMHRMTAATIHKCSYEDIGEDDPRRQHGKLTNLGTGYGMGWQKFIWYYFEQTGVMLTEQEAKAFLKGFHDAYPRIKPAQYAAEDVAAKGFKAAGSLAPFKGRKPGGWMKNLALKRVRRFCVLPEQEKIPDYKLKETYTEETEDGKPFYNEFKRRINKIRLAAYNHMIQSSCADIMKIAELMVWKKLKKEYKKGTFKRHLDRVLLIFHDEFLVMTQRKNVRRMHDIIYNCMMKAAQMFITVVPVKVSGGAGENWYVAGNEKLGKANLAVMLKECDDLEAKRKRRKAA